MALPVVSIIIPCRNQARYLRSALESVARQTRHDLEVIVVDDGSTDETSPVATEVGVKLLVQTHQGVSAARNRGLRESAAEYVIFLDADDELEPDAVERGIQVLEQHPDAWMVARRCVLIDESGSVLPTNCAPPTSPDLYGEWLERNLVWTPGAAIFRRIPLLDLGGFPADVGPAADYAVYLELARNNRVVFDASIAVRYRQHTGNMSRDAARMLRATLAVLRRERRHLPWRYRDRYERGLRAWQTFYGEEMIQDLRLGARARRLGLVQWRAMRLLVTECRALVLTHLARKLRRVAHGHPPGEVEPGRFTRASEVLTTRPVAGPREHRR